MEPAALAVDFSARLLAFLQLTQVLCQAGEAIGSHGGRAVKVLEPTGVSGAGPAQDRRSFDLFGPHGNP
jgi:hypothetical protein